MYCAYCFAIKKDSGSQRCHRCGEVYKRNSPLYLQPEGKLNKQYLIGRVLGHGGFGVTYLGYDIQLRTRVAIKEYYPKEWAYRDGQSGLLYPHGGETSQLFEMGKQRFIQEARLLTNFRNQNIIRVINSFEAMGTAYYIMEYLDGQTLNEYLRQQAQELRQEVHTLNFEETLQVIVPLMKGLQEVHQLGYIHRDIKPDNIYLSEQGFPVLLDFGSARSQRFVSSNSLDEVVTPGYSPYEQYYSAGNQGPWSDVYAMAATAYRLLTGQRPPDANDRATNNKQLISPRQRGAKLSQEEENWLLKGLTIRPEERPQSFRAWLQSLPGKRDSGNGGTDEASFIRMVILPKLNDKVLTYAEEEEIYRSAMNHASIGPERARELIEQYLVQTGSRRGDHHSIPDKPFPPNPPGSHLLGFSELLKMAFKPGSKGRVGRLEFFYFNNLQWASVALPAMLLVLFHQEMLASIFSVIAIIPYLLFSVQNIVKRFHDLNKSDTYSCLILVPFYNIILTWRLYFKKGTDGPNQYGPDPTVRKPTRLALVICSLLFIFNPICIYTIAILAGVMIGISQVADSPQPDMANSDSENIQSESTVSPETTSYDTSSDTATSEDNQTFVKELKANMHTLQTMVETYAVDWGGCYPKNLTALKQEATIPGKEYWKEIVNPITGKSGLGKSIIDTDLIKNNEVTNFLWSVVYTAAASSDDYSCPIVYEINGFGQKSDEFYKENGKEVALSNS